MTSTGLIFVCSRNLVLLPFFLFVAVVTVDDNNDDKEIMMLLLLFLPFVGVEIRYLPVSFCLRVFILVVFSCNNNTAALFFFFSFILHLSLHST